MATKNKQKDKKGKRQAQTILIVALILTSMFFSIYFRSYPARLPIADKWADNSIQNGLRAQIAGAVDQQYPNLPADRKEQLIQEQLAAYLQENEQSIKQQREEQANYIKSRLQTDNNQTYLLAIDPYYYLRRAENIIENGTVCDEVKDDQCWDDHQVAPIGKPTKPDYHSGFAAALHQVTRTFGNDAPPMNTLFWVPVIISSLAVIPAFFLARKRAGNLGGFIAAMIVAVHGTFIGRTAAGFSDTDGYNILFPLLIFWLFIEAFEAKELKNKLLYAGITGLALGIYSKIWQGWWYIFDFMLITIIVYVAYTLLRGWLRHKDLKKSAKGEETKAAGISMLAVLASSALFVSLFSSIRTFLLSPFSAISFTSIQNAVRSGLWPNVFTTVAELNRASLSSIVNQIGGSAYFYLALLGLVITLIPVKEFRSKDWLLLGGSAFIYLLLITTPLLTASPYLYLALLLLPVAYGLLSLLKDKRDIDIKYAIFLVVWFAGTIYASTQGVRFILMLVPPFAIALGILIGQLYRLISAWTAKEWDVDQDWVKLALIVLSLLILINPIRGGHQTALQEVPSMNDAWWAALEKIDEEAAPDAIINSWWDFGHWFKYVADRAVTFDGASQNTPMAHWIGRALSTQDEQEAVGILRMLDCGSSQGYDELASSLQGEGELTPKTAVRAHELMGEIILLESPAEAQAALRAAGLSEQEAQDVTALTHCEPPEDYFITSSDMVGKAGVWGHFGNWDFKKAYVYTELRKATPQEATPVIEDLFNTTSKEAGQIYYEAISIQSQQQGNAWISPWPNYLTSRAAACDERNGTLTCPINAGLGNQQGQRIVLEAASVNLADPSSARLSIGGYNPSTGQRLGGNEIAPKALIIPQNDTLKKVSFPEPGIDYELFIGEVDGRYRAVVASSELAASMFTRLYFFDGAYTNSFEHFTEERSPLTGDRIVVWKVAWE